MKRAGWLWAGVLALVIVAGIVVSVMRGEPAQGEPAASSPSVPASTRTPSPSPSPTAVDPAVLARLASRFVSGWLATPGLSTEARRAKLAPYAAGAALDAAAKEDPYSSRGAYVVGSAVSDAQPDGSGSVAVTVLYGSNGTGMWQVRTGPTPDGLRALDVAAE